MEIKLNTSFGFRTKFTKKNEKQIIHQQQILLIPILVLVSIEKKNN